MPEGKNYAPLHFPPRLNYSLDALREHNEEHYQMLLYIMEQLAINEFGVSHEDVLIHQKYSGFMIATGLIKPCFEDHDNYCHVYFEIWSILQKKYVDATELSDFEEEWIDYFFTRMFNVN